MGSMPGLLELIPLLEVMMKLDTASLNAVGSVESLVLSGVGSLDGLF